MKIEKTNELKLSNWIDGSNVINEMTTYKVDVSLVFLDQSL